MEDSEVSKYQLITQPTLDKFLPHFCQILFKLDGFISHCYHESHRGKRFETQVINGLAPSYLQDLCMPVTTVSTRAALRSAARGDLDVPRTRQRLGNRAFCVHSNCFFWDNFQESTQDSFIYPVILLLQSAEEGDIHPATLPYDLRVLVLTNAPATHKPANRHLVLCINHGWINLGF